MNKVLLISVLLIFAITISFAQKAIEVSTVSNPGGGYSFYAYNNSKVNYVINLNFTEFKNFKSNVRLPFAGELKPGNNYLFDLSPDIRLAETHFRYKYDFYIGCLNPTINLSYPYLLPIGEGKSVKIELNKFYYHLEDLRALLDSDNHNFIKGKTYKIDSNIHYYFDSNSILRLTFQMNYGDTIYAARKGEVISVTKNHKLENRNDSFCAKISNVEFYQNDCSIIAYQGIHDILVEIGQVVEAREPIALAGTLVDKVKAPLIFSVRYYDESWRNKFVSGYVPYSFYFTYINPVFITKEGKNMLLEDGHTYTSEQPEYIVTNEMTRKELKRWLRKHK